MNQQIKKVQDELQTVKDSVDRMNKNLEEFLKRK